MKTQAFNILPALLNLAAYVVGEEIAFYGGPHCTGRPDGEVSTHKKGKCYTVPVNAQSAVLDVTDKKYGESK